MSVKLLSVSEHHRRLTNEILTSWRRDIREWMKIFRSTRKYKAMNKNGQNKKQRRRNQVMLRGRRCVRHSGFAGRGRSSYHH
jgi:hypothetical protein